MLGPGFQPPNPWPLSTLLMLMMLAENVSWQLSGGQKAAGWGGGWSQADVAEVNLSQLLEVTGQLPRPLATAGKRGRKREKRACWGRGRGCYCHPYPGWSWSALVSETQSNYTLSRESELTLACKLPSLHLPSPHSHHLFFFLFCFSKFEIRFTFPVAIYSQCTVLGLCAQSDSLGPHRL